VAKPRRLVHESGINRTYLSGVERSEHNVSIDNIARIARGLQVKAWTPAGRQRQMIGAAGRAWTCIPPRIVMPRGRTAPPASRDVCSCKVKRTWS